jgi:hypothetical protein
MSGIPGKDLLVFIWFPELPGMSLNCLEGAFMVFSSVPGVSGKYYTWVVVSGDL